MPPVWLNIVIVVLLVLGALWLVMERKPHHQFIDACGTGDTQKLSSYLARPQDLNKAGWFGLTPLGEAIRNNNLENVKLLLKAGALTFIPGSRQTHLHTAVEEDAVDIARVLLEAGADPNAKSYIGDSPLKLAGIGNRLSMFKLLLENGADANANDSIPDVPGEPLIVRLVEKATKKPSSEELDQLIEMVGLLLDHGANINARNQLDTPLVGIAMPEIKMLRYLVSRSAITDVSWEGTDLGDIIAVLLETAEKPDVEASER